jgi:hypothetical protein
MPRKKPEKRRRNVLSRKVGVSEKHGVIARSPMWELEIF